jgi:predicted peptidase
MGFVSLIVHSISSSNVLNNCLMKTSTKYPLYASNYNKLLGNTNLLNKLNSDVYVSSKATVNNSSKKSQVNNSEQIFAAFSSNSKSYQAFSKGVKLSDPRYIVEGEYRYMLMEPETVDKSQALPLIVYLSGTGEYKLGELGTVGFVDKNKDGLISDDEVKHNALGTILSNWKLEDFNGYVIAPSLEGKEEKSWVSKNSEKYVRGLVGTFTKTHNVNPEMIFIGGHSIGGMGSLYMAKHASDLFSKAFTFSGFAHSSYDLKDISIPIIGYNGQGDSVFMDEDFASTFGSNNFVKVATKHGSVPINAFNRDANENGKSDLIEWLFEGKKLPENSNEY